MKESGEAFTKTETGDATVKGEKEEEAVRTQQQQRQRRRRRRLAWACGLFLLLLVILGTVALVLALVVFKIREPTATLNSVTLKRIASQLSLASFTLQLNLTLHLDLLIHNPNRASFSYGSGDTAVLYRGISVGQGNVQPGRIPARGDAHLAVNLTVDAARFAGDLPGLTQDLIAGRLELDTSTRIPGRVSFLGFIKRRALVLSGCEFVIGGLPQPKILEQQCRQKTEL
ncbi:unnamed protein product [Spirodela intermedia]|uniref:Late embryogenesis abundant protein LEA-2 subgroup domain-containing protein n=1 Tax=Spirodela intermedia TaxID=51605 RepID=A0A7I8L8P9_SPIIN|nr:unnamed protein product [Spirodela intermedia]